VFVNTKQRRNKVQRRKQTFKQVFVNTTNKIFKNLNKKKTDFDPEDG